MSFLLNLVVSVLACGLAVSVNIEITTQYQDGTIPNAFNIRCTPETDGICTKTIISIQVTKDEGKNIANIQGHDAITYNRLMRSSLMVEGHIDRDIKETFLSVTVKEAVKEDSGLYTCKILYTDESLQFKVDTASQNVTISNRDTQDIVRHLLSKLSILENMVQFQQEELSKVNTRLIEQETRISTVKNNRTDTSTMQRLRRLETDLSAQRVNFTARLDRQRNVFSRRLGAWRNESIVHYGNFQQQLLTLTNQMNGLRQRRGHVYENMTTYFTALHTTRGDFRVERDLVYRDIITNVGRAYHGPSGVFTAPVTGIYMFSLSMMADKGKRIYVDLKTDDGQVLTRLYVGNNNWYDHNAVSCLVKLDNGQKVVPWIRWLTNSFSMYELDSSDKLNKFEGYLLQRL